MTKNCLVLLVALPLGGCYGLYGHDEVDRYFQRSDSLTMSAGDAKQANAVAQTIHPWPSYVSDRRLAYDARRVGGAVTRYGNQQRPRDQLPDVGETGEAMGPPPPAETIQTRNVNSNVIIEGSGTSARSTSVTVGN